MNVSPDLNSLLVQPAPFYQRARVWLLLFLLIGVATGAYLWSPPEQTPLRFKTLTVARGDLSVRVNATGTLQPLKQVDVGSEVSGTVAEVFVDHNARVSAGQVLARLDTTKLEAQAAQARASLALAEAKLQDAQASVFEARKTVERYRKMHQQSQQSPISEEALDSAEASYKRARASEAVARAQIAEAEAKLKIDQTNLDKAVIRAPISGVVLMRLIEPGQTVAASLQAPVLFSLAEDLAQMELQVDVDEADVGLVAADQSASFSVDAYPDRRFQARITQVRYASQRLNNVVTYLTSLAVDNADLSLRPGMTATADIVVQELRDVLLVPNTALRFSPPSTNSASKPDLLSRLLPRPPRRNRNPAPAVSKNGWQRVWIMGADGQPQSLSLKLGASDGHMSALMEGEVQEGMALLVEVVQP
jgi:HlyD family secretion protein